MLLGSSFSAPVNKLRNALCSASLSPPPWSVTRISKLSERVWSSEGRSSTKMLLPCGEAATALLTKLCNTFCSVARTPRGTKGNASSRFSSWIVWELRLLVYSFSVDSTAAAAWLPESISEASLELGSTLAEGARTTPLSTSWALAKACLRLVNFALVFVSAASSSAFCWRRLSTSAKAAACSWSVSSKFASLPSRNFWRSAQSWVSFV